MGVIYESRPHYRTISEVRHDFLTYLCGNPNPSLRGSSIACKTTEITIQNLADDLRISLKEGGKP